MARLVGVDLPRDKRLEIALTYIYGIGRTRALETLSQTGVSGDIRVHDLTDDDLVKLRDWIEANYRSKVTCAARSRPTSVARSRSGATRASATAAGLPVRGQRTQTNARTRKGPSKTVAGKKKAGKK